MTHRKYSSDEEGTFKLNNWEEEDESDEQEDKAEVERIRNIAKQSKKEVNEVDTFLEDHKLDDLKYAMTALNLSKLDQLKELGEPDIK